MEDVKIRSVHGQELSLHSKEYDNSGQLKSYQVSINAPNLSATISIEQHEHQRDPIKFFNSLKKKWSGWKNTIEWSSTGEHLKLSATSDNTGHVYIDTILIVDDYAPPWEARVTMVIESGQLETIFKKVLKFYQT